MSVLNFWSQNVPYIRVFDFHHNLYIGLMLLLLILLVKFNEEIIRKQKQIRLLILFILIVQQVALYSWYIFETGFDIGESLPLHISRISSILCLIYLLTTNKKVMDVLFYFGLYAYGSFLYPSRVYPFYHLMGLSFFINHAITILLPIVAIIISDWRPSLSALFKAYGWFLLYFTFVYFLNPLIDGNYFYLKYRPFLGHLPDSQYIPIVLFVTLILFVIGYLTSNLILSKINNKKEEPV